MRVHRYLPCTRVNGPGRRFALWVQGCSRNCPGCFNPLTQKKNGGSEVAVDEIMNLIPIQDVEGITISGGEPFEQPEELSKLLTLAALSDLHRLVYTGYRYEELKTMKNWSIDLCLGLTDMLIDGAYDWTIPQKHPWAGSGNQRILFLEQGKIVDDQETLEAMGIQEAFTGLGEITIDSLGGITATGFMDSQVLQEKA